MFAILRGGAPHPKEFGNHDASDVFGLAQEGTALEEIHGVDALGAPVVVETASHDRQSSVRSIVINATADVEGEVMVWVHQGGVMFLEDLYLGWVRKEHVPDGLITSRVGPPASVVVDQYSSPAGGRPPWCPRRGGSHGGDSVSDLGHSATVEAV